MSVPGFSVTMFEKVLVANRGEIAVRILRTLKEMGIESVAVYSEADVEALPARLADEAVLIGPPAPAQSYLNVESVLAAARQTGASAIHPGYGFLSENAKFAEACATAGLTFIGPSPESLRLAGNKLQARRSVESAGVPVIPGSNQPLRELSVARRLAASIGYPAMLKAVAGGGGKGIRSIADEDALVEAFPLAQAEARASFGDPTLYLERRIEGARHIEVQVLRDSKGKAVHLGERNCSLQRRHQKLLEEAPSPALPREVARQLHEAALTIVEATRYRSAGTVEFLVDADNRFYFLEVNARIQVEHPVTEAITGVDLVRAQVEEAATGELSLSQSDIAFRGHAIECRINAEDPDDGFLPQPGTIETFRSPAGPSVRFDTHVFEGYAVPFYYDSLLAKVITHGATREEAIDTMRSALSELVIGPIHTTAPFLKRVLEDDAFRKGSYTLDLLPRLAPESKDDEA